MNKRNVYSKVKKGADKSLKALRQLVFSTIVFLLVISISALSVEFKETARYYTKSDTDFKIITRVVYEKIQECFKTFSDEVDIR